MLVSSLTSKKSCRRAGNPATATHQRRRSHQFRISNLVSGGAGRPVAESGLGGGQAGDRHAKRRARHVVEPDLVAECNGGSIAAMLAADAELEVVPNLASALAGDPYEFSDTLAVDGDEWIGGENPFGGIDAEEACGVVSANAERGLGEVVGAERKEFRRLGDLAGEKCGARQLDHGADLIFDRRAGFLGDRRGAGDRKSVV